MSDDYGYRFASDGMGINGSHRGDGSKPVPVVTSKPERFYEPGRFARAKALLPFVRQIGTHQYTVKGADEPLYVVDLEGDPMCYCADSFNRGRMIQGRCKHVLACMLREYYPPLVMAMADDIYARMERDKESADND